MWSKYDERLPRLVVSAPSTTVRDSSSVTIFLPVSPSICSERYLPTMSTLSPAAGLGFFSVTSVNPAFASGLKSVGRVWPFVGGAPWCSLSAGYSRHDAGSLAVARWKRHESALMVW